MKIKVLKYFLMLVVLLFFIQTVSAQNIFKLPEKQKTLELSFENYNNLIVIPITINNYQTKFILDTGVKSTILTEQSIANLLGLNYSGEYSLKGAGEEEIVMALIAEGVRISIDQAVCEESRVLVLVDDFLELPSYLGVNVQGIIGADIFESFIVQIDYANSKIKLIKPSKFKVPSRRYQSVPLSFYNSKPYGMFHVKTDDDKEHKFSLLIDSGASHAALFELNDIDDFLLPQNQMETVVGRGLAGNINGSLGRINELGIANYVFEDAVVSFTDEYSVFRAQISAPRQGTIGGEFLSRFIVIFNYHNHTMYLKKNRNFKRTFDINMSGMWVKAGGLELNSFEVIKVQENSPADNAGVRVGDRITRMNGVKDHHLKLNDINAMMRTKPGRKVRLRIDRENEEIKIKFRLQKLI